MKKLCAILAITLCISFISGCSIDITVRDENGSSVAIPDGVESAIQNILSDAATTTTLANTPNSATTTTDGAVDTNSKTPDTTASTKKHSKNPATTSKSQAGPKATVGKYINAISINKLPNKTTYITGDELDITGLAINRLYSDGSSDTINSGFTVMGFSSKKPGQKTLTVVYKHENGSTLLCTYDIKIEKKQHNTPNIKNNFHHDLEKEVLVLVNKARKNAGLNELKMDNGALMNAADIRAKEITINWAHERPDHDPWDSVYDEELTDYKIRGENLGKGDIPTDGSSASQNIFDAWMNSRDHKANIMSPSFTHVSIACLEYNECYYWVQLFGAK